MAKDTTSMGGAFPPNMGKAAKASGGAQPAAAPVTPEGVINRVVGRTTNAVRKIDPSKLAMKQTGSALLHTTETLGTLFMGSMAEGYLGHDKLKLGGMDMRAPVGMAAQAYGLYSIMTGEKGGAHALALGNGVTGSWIASVGRDAGQALRDRKGGAPTPVQGSTQAGASFRGESPMVHIPELGPEAVYGQIPFWQGQPMPVPSWQGYAGVPAPSMQGTMMPAVPVQMNGYGPGYAQHVPQYAPGYGPAQHGYGAGYAPQPVYGAAPQPVYGAAPQPGYGAQVPQPGWPQPGTGPQGFAQPGVMQPGLLPEPGPRVAGAPREIMLTPETQVIEGPLHHSMPQMMLTPEAAPQGQFQGQRIMLTPEAQAQVAQRVQHRREAAAQAFHQAQTQVQAYQQAHPQAYPQTQPQAYQAAQTAPETTVAGGAAALGEGFAGPRQQGRRDAVRQMAQNRFPSASALNEEPGA